MAQEFGMTVEWPKDSSGKELTWVTERCDLTLIFPDEKTLSCLFRAIQDGAFDMVLENDRIRILPHEQALAFWKEWWAAEEKTK